MALKTPPAQLYQDGKCEDFKEVVDKDSKLIYTLLSYDLTRGVTPSPKRREGPTQPSAITKRIFRSNVLLSRGDNINLLSRGSAASRGSGGRAISDDDALLREVHLSGEGG
ncbi:hypothetical protein O988_06088, partial [Pseudogymnoascus sp. VKM F-3808]